MLGSNGPNGPNSPNGPYGPNGSNAPNSPVPVPTSPSPSPHGNPHNSPSPSSSPSPSPHGNPHNSPQPPSPPPPYVPSGPAPNITSTTSNSSTTGSVDYTAPLTGGPWITYQCVHACSPRPAYRQLPALQLLGPSTLVPCTAPSTHCRVSCMCAPPAQVQRHGLAGQNGSHMQLHCAHAHLHLHRTHRRHLLLGRLHRAGCIQQPEQRISTRHAEHAVQRTERQCHGHPALQVSAPTRLTSNSSAVRR